MEDDRRTAFAYESLLTAKRSDIAVETVFSAEEGLLHLSKGNYDVILSDFKLPGLDGLGLLVASYCLHSPVPFILISAYGDRDLEESAARLGAYAVLHKPIASDIFLHVIERALTKGRSTIKSVEPPKFFGSSMPPERGKTVVQERTRFGNDR